MQKKKKKIRKSMEFDIQKKKRFNKSVLLPIARKDLIEITRHKSKMNGLKQD